METNINQRVINANSVFTTHYIESKILYLYLFNQIPCISYLPSIDGEKAYLGFKEKYGQLIQSVHTYREYHRKRSANKFNDTILILKNECIVEFNETYCEIHHGENQNDFVKELNDFCRLFKKRARRQPFEISILVKNGNYLEFKAMEIRKTKLDIGLWYNDDFAPVDALITKRLNQKNDKGIVLLHGLPGTGKTTYLRYLIGKLKKKVIFLSPNMAHSLVDPEFMEMLIDNPNSIVVIEDAEHIITDRKISNSSSVSNLLNISDGLLADFLNVQLVCTFNNSLTLVDSALLRKGRLIAKYEFGKLSTEKATLLAVHFGNKMEIKQPMTIAEIANPNEADAGNQQMEVIGFRRKNEWMMN